MSPEISRSILSKKRYNEIESEIKKHVDNEKLEVIMESIRRVMHFDPDKPAKTPEQYAKDYEKRNKLKEAGVSTYVSSGMKRHYEKKKAAKASAYVS